MTSIIRRRRRSRSPDTRRGDAEPETLAAARRRQQTENECGAVLHDLVTVGSGVELAPSTLGADAGLGLFAQETFEQNQPVTEYYGELITSAEAVRRYNAGEASHLRRLIPLRWVIDGTRHADTGELIGGPGEMLGRGGGAYCNDPIAASRANVVFDFVDCEKNQQTMAAFRAGARLAADPFDPKERIVFLRATRMIKPGEEIFVSYGDDYWQGKRPLSVADRQ